jgi:hypothetical protein
MARRFWDSILILHRSKHAVKTGSKSIQFRMSGTGHRVSRQIPKLHGEKTDLHMNINTFSTYNPPFFITSYKLCSAHKRITVRVNLEGSQGRTQSFLSCPSCSHSPTQAWSAPIVPLPYPKHESPSNRPPPLLSSSSLPCFAASAANSSGDARLVR